MIFCLITVQIRIYLLLSWSFLISIYLNLHVCIVCKELRQPILYLKHYYSVHSTSYIQVHIMAYTAVSGTLIFNTPKDYILTQFRLIGYVFIRTFKYTGRRWWFENCFVYRWIVLTKIYCQDDYYRQTKVYFYKAVTKFDSRYFVENINNN